MNKNLIVMAVLGISLLGNQLIVAADQSTSGSTVLTREFRAFKEALACARTKDFSQCSRPQKKRVIIAGIALVVVLAGTYGGYRGVSSYLGKRRTEREVREKAEREKTERKGEDLRKSTLVKSGSFYNLVRAVEEGRLDDVKLLVEAGGLDVDQSRGNLEDSLLYYAIRLGKDEIAQYLISKGADVRADSDFERTALHLVRDGKTASMLIDKGADVNALDGRGNTPLSLAVSRTGTSEFRLALPVVNELLVGGANPDLGREDEQLAPLHLAARARNLQVTQWLLNKGAKVDILSDKGGGDKVTPLDIAVQNNAVAVAKVLIEKGAAVDREDARGATLFSRARSKEMKELIGDALTERKEALSQSLPPHLPVDMRGEIGLQFLEKSKRKGKPVASSSKRARERYRARRKPDATAARK